MANYTSTHTGAVIDASVTKVSASGVTQADLSKLNAVTSTAVELNLLDGVTATTAELNILDGVTATATELNYLDGADSSITTLSLPDNTTITTFGASLIDDADAAAARTTLGVDAAGTDNSTDVTLVTTSYDYLSISGQAITLGQIDISDDTNLVGGDGLALTGDTLSVNVDDSSLEINSDTLRVKALGVTNAMLAGSIANSKLSNSSVSYGGISVALGSSDATPAFDLSDATSLPIVAGTTGTLSVARGGTGATTASDARTNLNVDVAGTDNSTDVTLVTTSHDYLSLSGQAITLGTIDIGDDTNLVGGTGITLTGDTLSTTDSDIVHDNLSGFVANEHIDHSGVSITAGAGLTGGGDITATRDIAVGAGTGVTVNADDVAIGQDVATSADVTFNSVTADIIGDIRGATKFQAKADVALNKGDAVYISGVSGTTPTVDIADANDSAKMPSFGLAASSVSINASVEIITFGTLAGLNTSSFSVGDIIYISTNGTSGNTLTATAPTGETSLIQNIGIVQRSHASSGSIKVGGAGRTNATPNLDDGDIFIGNGSNQAVTASLNTKIEDYLDGGTSTANFDTISVDGAEITATPAELNVLDGITSTTAELNYTDGVTSNIQTQLDAKAPLASPAFTGTATGANLTLSGDLTVNGSTTTLDTTNLAVEDNLMELNAGVTSNANDSGFLIERGTTGDNAIFMWDESADKFTLGTTTATGTTTGDITLSSTGTLVASLEGNVTGDVTGNADTATALATGRNFSLTGDVTAGAVSFDGSGNVALSTTIAANSVALGTDTTGNYMSDLTEGTGIDITHTPAEGSNATIALDLTEVGFGGGANRLITDDGDGTVSTEAGFTIDGTTLLIGDNKVLGIGNGTDLELKHDTNQNYIDLNLGNLTFRDELDNNVFRIKKDGGIALLEGDAQIPATSRLYLDGGGDTFWYEAAANVAMLVSGGAERLRTTSTGNIVINEPGNSVDLRVEGNTDANLFFVDGSADRVGIGTSSPSTKMHIKDASNNVDLRIETDKVNGNAQVQYLNDARQYNAGINNVDAWGVYDATAAETRFTINSSGNVGIGTTSPSGRLHIKTPASANADLFVEATDFTPTLRMYSGGANIGSLIRFGTGSGASKLRLQSITAGGGISGAVSDVMTLQENGNVGIGTTSPSALLHLNEDDNVGAFLVQGGGGGVYLGRFQRDVGGSSYVDIHCGTDDPQITFTTSAAARQFSIGADSSANSFKISENSLVGTNDRFVIDDSGNVGIGTSLPGALLDVAGDGKIQNDLWISTDLGELQFGAGKDGRLYSYNDDLYIDNQTLDQDIHLRVNDGGVYTTALFIDGDTSRVGIGTESPSADLHINTSDDGSVYFTRGGLYPWSIEHDTSQLYFYNRTINKSIIKLTHAGTMVINNDKNGSVDFRVAGTVDTYGLFYDASANALGIGTSSPGHKLQVSGGDIAIDVGERMYFGAGNHTYISEDIDDRVRFFCGGAEFMRFTEDTSDTLGLYTNNTLRVSVNNDGDVLPGADGTQDLGASANRWGVVYSADLDLSNEGSQNDVDGTWGSYVIQEGEEDLFLINRRNGKKYKFMLQEVQD